MFSQCIYLHQLQDQCLTCEQSLNICFKGAFCTPTYIPASMLLMLAWRHLWGLTAKGVWLTEDFPAKPRQQSDCNEHEMHMKVHNPELRKGVVAEDILCSTTGAQWKKATEQEVMWWACPPPPSQHYEIWPLSKWRFNHSNHIHGAWNIWDNNPWIWAQACSMQALNSH